MSKEGGKVSSDAEDIPERLDAGVEESNNAQSLSATLIHRWTCVGEKCNTHTITIIVIIITSLSFCTKMYITDL